MVDSMHCVDLGTALLIIANVLVSICIQGHFGAGHRKAQLENLYADYEQWCADHKIYSKLERFTQDDNRKTMQPTFEWVTISIGASGLTPALCKPAV